MTPKLRFPNFQSNWRKVLLSEIATKSKTKNTGFTESLVLTNSAKYGVIAQENFFDRQIVTEGNLESYSVVLEGSFVYNPRISVTAPCGPINRNDYRNGIMSPLYVIFDVDTNLSDFLRCYFRTTKWHIYAKAVSNYGVRFDRMNITTTDFFSMPIHIPSESNERNRIVEFIETISTKINLLTKKKEALETFKKGLMQKIFSQELRFKREDGTDYPEWKTFKLSEVLIEHKKRSDGSEQVHSVSVHKGVVNQIEHLGRSFAAKDVSNYNKVLYGDIIYTKSPTGDFPYGIIKQSYVERAIVSPLYCVTSPVDINIGYLLNWFFESKINVHNYLHPIIQKGAKNTINITNTTFLSRSLTLPSDMAERQKIKDVYSSLNDNLRTLESEILKVTEFKKGLLQQMFV